MPTAARPGRLYFVPLDDRPICRYYPVTLAERAGFQVQVPPLKALGYYRSAGEFDALKTWLTNLPDVEATLVLSLDMLVYGGLIGSREKTVGLAQALERLNFLRIWRTTHPHIKLYAFGVIRRLAASVFKKTDEQKWKETHEAGTNIKRQAAVLAERSRNLQVNLASVDLLQDQVINFLLLTQEDASPGGVQLQEQAQLREQAHGLDESQFIMRPGADEAGSVLVARAYGNFVKYRPSIGVYCPDAAAWDRIPRYEDSPLAGSIPRHLESLGPGLAAKFRRLELKDLSGKLDCDFVLALWPPGEAEEGDHGLDRLMSGKVSSVKNIKALPELIQFLKQVKIPCALADIRMANGPDPFLSQALDEELLWSKLLSYSAWNTAANTLGTCLGLAFLRLAAPKQDWSWPFLERILDDDWYQGRVRPILYGQVVDPWNMSDSEKARCLSLVAEEFGDLPEAYQALKVPMVQFDFSWNRLFEIALSLGQ